MWQDLNNVKQTQTISTHSKLVTEINREEALRNKDILTSTNQLQIHLSLPKLLYLIACTVFFTLRISTHSESYNDEVKLE